MIAGIKRHVLNQHLLDKSSTEGSEVKALRPKSNNWEQSQQKLTRKPEVPGKKMQEWRETRRFSSPGRNQNSTSWKYNSACWLNSSFLRRKSPVYNFSSFIVFHLNMHNWIECLVLCFEGNANISLSPFILCSQTAQTVANFAFSSSNAANRGSVHSLRQHSSGLL